MKSISVTCLLFFVSTAAFGQEPFQTFTVENSIVIEADIDTVFDFAANPMNDTQWRSEVNAMSASGPWEEGTIYYEDSHLGFNPHYITPTILIELDPSDTMVVETPEDNLYLQAKRTFEERENGNTLMTYRLEVDVRMPTDAAGFYIPPLLAKIYYNNVMRVYLWRLKTILENE